jgi:hypothetical protein
MVGILSALPNTPLFARLEKEGRLRPEVPGDQFGLTNVVTRMPADQMLHGYRRVLETVYHPETYFQRCRENLARWKPVAGCLRPLGPRDVVSGLCALWGQGFTGKYRKAYWQFLEWVVRHHPDKIGRAVAQAAAGHHYITYTQNIVVPSILSKLPTLANPEPLLAT